MLLGTQFNVLSVDKRTQAGRRGPYDGHSACSVCQVAAMRAADVCCRRDSDDDDDDNDGVECWGCAALWLV